MALKTQILESMLAYGVDVLAETILEGLSRVKKCNNEGRALMSLDLQVLSQRSRLEILVSLLLGN